ncbi:hypothetical protein CBF27_13825 [Vagococcus acidifermentans]|uniref:Uncharacterized protein n=1 Tax=Vagococcus acidifermentans TaxID=564710 RepID=A0A430ALH3_9ENTE|nr:hypothetical protein CBF27_13825 [Vagococcus acidifermentans]
MLKQRGALIGTLNQKELQDALTNYVQEDLSGENELIHIYADVLEMMARYIVNLKLEQCFLVAVVLKIK